MRKIATTILIIIVFLVVTLVTLAVIPPTGIIRGLIAKAVKHETGRELVVKGETEIRLVPSARVRFEDVALSNPPGITGEPQVRASAVEAELPFWDVVRLAFGSGSFDRIRVENPRIDMAVDLAGPPPGTGGTTRSTEPAAGLNLPYVGQLTITNGTIALRDQRAGTRLELAGFEAEGQRLAWPSLGELKAKSGQAKFRAERSGMQVELNGASIVGSGVQWPAIDVLSVQAGAGLYDEGGAGRRLELVAFTAAGKQLAALVSAAPTAGELSVRGDAAKYEERSTGRRVDLGKFNGGGKQVPLFAPLSASLGELSGSSDVFRLVPDRSSAAIELERANGSLRRVATGGGHAAEVDVVWNKERIAGRGIFQSLEALLKGNPTKSVVALAGKHGKADLDGELAIGPATKLAGKASASTPSLRSLMAWLDRPLPAGEGLGPTTAEGTLDALLPTRISVANGRFGVDDTKAQGTLAVDMGGLRPRITGTLNADQFDANRYLGIETRTRTRAPRPAEKRVATEIPVKEALKAYLDAIESPRAPSPSRAPPAPNRSAGEAWSDEPISLAALRSLDLDLNLVIGKLKLMDFELGVSRLKAGLNDGELKLDGGELATRGGRVTGDATINARGAVPTIAAIFQSPSIDLDVLQEDLGLEQQLIAGSSSLEADLKGSFKSLRDLMSSLSGRLKAQVGEGSIVGYDASRIWDFIKAGGVPPYNPDRSTPFDRLQADLKLDKGVAETSFLELDGRVVGGDADGKAMLATRELDATARLTRHPLSWLAGPFFGHIFGFWQSLKFETETETESRSREGPSRDGGPAIPANIDLSDPELAALVERALKIPNIQRELGTQGTQMLRNLQQKLVPGLPQRLPPGLLPR